MLSYYDFLSINNVCARLKPPEGGRIAQNLLAIGRKDIEAGHARGFKAGYAGDGGDGDGCRLHAVIVDGGHLIGVRAT